MMKTMITFALLVSLSACVSISPRAAQIHLYSQGDAHVSHCERLGRLSAEAAGLGQLNVANAQQQATNNLLDVAAKRWLGRVDSVEIISVEKGVLNFTAVGVAFNCAN